MTYLPRGTVVTLVNGTKPIMIYGRKQIQQGNENIWDYVACLYPEGNIGEDYKVFFQHKEIDKIYHYGLESSDEDKMQQILNRA